MLIRLEVEVRILMYEKAKQDSDEMKRWHNGKERTSMLEEMGIPY